MSVYSQNLPAPGPRSPSPDRPRRLTAALLVAVSALPALAGEVSELRFVDRAQELGIEFVHSHFGTGEKYMPENMGSGGAILDVNGDGLLDIYLVQGAPLPPAEGPPPEEALNRLFLQEEDGSFRDATRESGLGDGGYGQGVTWSDYDRDGDPDIYVTNYGRNTLFRNRGDGTFEDVTVEAHVECPLWSASAGFFDAEEDGDLDLYVVNYLDFSFENHKWCGSAELGVRAYCHPDVYNSLPDCYYRNNGDGTFTEAREESGMIHTEEGVGLGVGFADLDGNGTQDILVANDHRMNYLYLGDGKGRFTESALLAGVGFSGAGQPESSMGVEMGDVDGDGLLDLFLTHLDQQTNTLYRNLGQGMFLDITDTAGLAAPSLPWVGFGTILFDHDNDGDLDLLVTNGHIIDNIELFDASRASLQPSQFFEQRGGGRFIEVEGALDLPPRLMGRGAVSGDLDRDGDLDVLLTQNNGRAFVLLNRLGSGNRSLGVTLEGTKSNPHGWGARLELATEGGTQTRFARGASSYMSQGASEVYFGLGEADQAKELVVTWPSGQVDRHGPLKAGFLYTLTEGSAEVQARPFGPPKP